jgi:hypothetical protein
MSAPAAVSAREAKVAARATRRQAKIGARRALRKASRELDVAVPAGVSAGNGRSPFATVEEERKGRQELTHGSLEALRRQWPKLKARLGKIADLRHPKKIKHRLDVLMLYGILMFVLQKASRREANREMTGPQLMENLRLYFPEIEQLPHQDTLHRVLANTEPGNLEEALTERIAELIRNKKFARYLVEKCYPIAMDGTQKLKRNELVCGEWLTRNVRHADGSEALSAQNVHARCNLGARYRWGIEEGILVEKRHWYHYEHCFSEDWNAMRCYHYLMRIGHLINVLVWYSTAVNEMVRKLGVSGVLRLVWTTLVGPWLDAQAVRERFRRPWQLRLI